MSWFSWLAEFSYVSRLNKILTAILALTTLILFGLTIHFAACLNWALAALCGTVAAAASGILQSAYYSRVHEFTGITLDLQQFNLKYPRDSKEDDRKRIKEALEISDQSRKQGQEIKSQAFSMEAERTGLLLLSPEELAESGKVLHSKLSALAKGKTDIPNEFLNNAPTTALEVYAVASILDEQRLQECGNWYLLREQLRVLIAAIILSSVFAALTIYVSITSLNPNVSMGRAILIAAPLLGIVGAGLSSIRSSRRTANDLSLWRLVLRAHFTLMRLLVGAVAGLVIVILLKSEVINLVNTRDWTVLAFAFIAGFSEQFFVSRIENIIGRVESRGIQQTNKA